MLKKPAAHGLRHGQHVPGQTDGALRHREAHVPALCRVPQGDMVAHVSGPRQ